MFDRRDDLEVIWFALLLQEEKYVNSLRELDVSNTTTYTEDHEFLKYSLEQVRSLIGRIRRRGYDFGENGDLTVTEYRP